MHYDANDFLVRPAKIGSVRRTRWRRTTSASPATATSAGSTSSHAFYWVFGTRRAPADRRPRRSTSSAQLAALELSVDRDWARVQAQRVLRLAATTTRATARASGFDAIYDNPNFAGGPFSFWSRSGIALTQTGVLLKAPGSLLPSLRANKFEGQANFVNPGLLLFGAGLDLELTPKLRASPERELPALPRDGRARRCCCSSPASGRTIGVDLGGGLLYRPLLNENIVVTRRRRRPSPRQRLRRPLLLDLRRAGLRRASPKLYNGFVAAEAHVLSEVLGCRFARRIVIALLASGRPRRARARATQRGPGLAALEPVAGGGRPQERGLPQLPHADGRARRCTRRLPCASAAPTATAATPPSKAGARRARPNTRTAQRQGPRAARRTAELRKSRANPERSYTALLDERRRVRALREPRRPARGASRLRPLPPRGGAATSRRA